MIPTYISSIILRPGASYPFRCGDSDITSIDPMLGHSYYSVTRDKMVNDGEELVDNEGKLDETLFMITSIDEVDLDAPNWEAQDEIRSRYIKLLKPPYDLTCLTDNIEYRKYASLSLNTLPLIK